MDEYLIQGSTLTDIADAIREKTGDSALMTPAEMVEAIGSISGGGLPLLVSYESITVENDRISQDTGGTTQAFANEFMPKLQVYDGGYPIILILIENTNKTEYSGQCAARLSTIESGNATNRFFARRNLSNVVLGNYWFYIGAGSVIHKFVFVRKEFLA